MAEKVKKGVVYCGDHENSTILLHDIWDTYAKEKNELVERIEDLFPDASITDGSRRVKKGILNIVGDGLHYLFGSARDSDVLAISNQVRNALAAGSSGTGQLQSQIDKLASMTTLTNRRIEISNTQIQHLKWEMGEMRVKNEMTLKSANELMIFITRKLHLSQISMVHLNVLWEALKGVANGILAPEIVPPRQLRTAIQNITSLLKSKYSNFHLIARRPAFYYAQGRVHAVRTNDTLLLELKMPLSSGALDLVNIFEVIQTRSPTPNGLHATFIKNLPKFVADD